MKWVIIAFVGVIGYMIATGNMGGATKATQNYADVMYGGPKDGSSSSAKPAVMHEYIKNKEKGSIK
ncbi:MAG: hypothetical protein U9R39_07395 [Campylobacterota bacterium]|nr:hypothetical protein [Campylobacterota bacterium]